MSNCSFCGCEIDYLPFRCHHCDKPFCSDHRLPEAHKCQEFKPENVFSRPSRRTEKAHRCRNCGILTPTGHNICRKCASKEQGIAVGGEEGYRVDSWILPEKTPIQTWVSRILWCIFWILFVSCVLNYDYFFEPLKGSGEPNTNNIEKDIHTRINQVRKSRGLTLLEFDPKLAEIARYHSKDMANRSYFSHDDLEGNNFDHRYKQFGYGCEIFVSEEIKQFQHSTFNMQKFLGGSENIFECKPRCSSYDVVKGWMGSTSHRENILTPQWKKEGIGVVYSEGTMHVTQNFC